MILGAGILQVSTIRKANELGLKTLVLDANPDAVGFKDADSYYIVDITDNEKVLQIAQKEKIDGIIHPCSEVAMHSMGYVIESMCLMGIDRNTAIKATNKSEMRKAFSLAGASSPISKTARTKYEALLAYKSLNFDTIIKPSRNSGSRGVSFIGKGSSDEIVSDAFQRALNESKDNSVVIEQFVSGPEFSVELLIWDDQIIALTVTDKLTTDIPFFIELGHSQPSRFESKQVDQIVLCAIDGVKALNLKQCVAHAEIKLSKDGPYLMEIGARLGGDFISTELVRLSTGIDMIQCAINIALGKKPDLKRISEPQGAAIRYFTPNPGMITSISDIDKWHNDKQVIDLQMYVTIGDRVKSLQSSLDRCGHVITIGKSADEAIALAESIINDIEFIVE